VGTAWGVPGLSAGESDEDRRGGDYTRYGAAARDVALRPAFVRDQMQDIRHHQRNARSHQKA